MTSAANPIARRRPPPRRPTPAASHRAWTAPARAPPPRSAVSSDHGRSGAGHRGEPRCAVHGAADVTKLRQRVIVRARRFFGVRHGVALCRNDRQFTPSESTLQCKVYVTRGDPKSRTRQPRFARTALRARIVSRSVERSLMIDSAVLPISSFLSPVRAAVPTHRQPGRQLGGECTDDIRGAAFHHVDRRRLHADRLQQRGRVLPVASRATAPASTRSPAPPRRS